MIVLIRRIACEVYMKGQNIALIKHIFPYFKIIVKLIMYTWTFIDIFS